MQCVHCGHLAGVPVTFRLFVYTLQIESVGETRQVGLARFPGEMSLGQGATGWPLGSPGFLIGDRDMAERGITLDWRQIWRDLAPDSANQFLLILLTRQTELLDADLSA